ncbi:hypothetical protein [Mycobacterium sp. ITM-2016-00318]|uniref:hypothetical protein n=1 Tax=Mycobacterium sp. ITM-2016-00318 TaxID=2099693 RepID=UPI0018EBC103|nr:hypothetical protein [Mycobacterium sp. ITM-2016-00318]WNG95729.1 hypothetical protein C6A82_022165 [Mycobacterium sp. ITM-2016-00318]
MLAASTVVLVGPADAALADSGAITSSDGPTQPTIKNESAAVIREINLEASLEHYISSAAKLMRGDVHADITRLSQQLQNLREQREAWRARVHPCDDCDD